MSLASGFAELLRQVSAFDDAVASLEARSAERQNQQRDELDRVNNTLQELSNRLSSGHTALVETVNRLAATVDGVDQKYRIFKSAVDPHNTQAAIERVNALSVQRENELREDLTRRIDQVVEDAYRSMDVRQELSDRARAVLQTAVASIGRDLTALTEKYAEMLEQGRAVRGFLEQRGQA